MLDFFQFQLCKFPYVSVRLTYDTLAGPVRVPEDMKNIEDCRAGSVRCLYGHRTGYPWIRENYSTKPLVYSHVKPYGAHILMWPWEQHRRKIHTDASLGLTGKKSYGWYKTYGAVVGCDWGITSSILLYALPQSVYHCMQYCVRLQGDPVVLFCVMHFPLCCHDMETLCTFSLSEEIHQSLMDSPHIC